MINIFLIFEGATVDSFGHRLLVQSTAPASVKTRYLETTISKEVLAHNISINISRGVLAPKARPSHESQLCHVRPAGVSLGSGARRGGGGEDKVRVSQEVDMVEDIAWVRV